MTVEEEFGVLFRAAVTGWFDEQTDSYSKGGGHASAMAALARAEELLGRVPNGPLLRAKVARTPILAGTEEAFLRARYALSLVAEAAPGGSWAPGGSQTLGELYRRASIYPEHNP